MWCGVGWGGMRFETASYPWLQNPSAGLLFMVCFVFFSL
uniref:Uncharacterized protein n=1 Tax=Anguilla anguilla TaxID=7936 RepID=A0A0E9QNK6_ANGAN